ncbi:glycosyltransferase [Salidesulfovibrio onnuriiensis]|uniref:glycosyltransferase n=1 Tax=Salidesulfovibrio onnuriiensis TaxID=2583823 RepID=UPI0011CAA208|nr:glycosyltransferase [Salidesulfovibrio onnuriiensis]
MDYHHFIITRFNVNIYDIDFPARLEETWLAERFDLFQKFCFPSIRAQHNQNFTWLVLFDEQTPARYRALIKAWSRYENFVPVYCGAFTTIMPAVVERMREIAPHADWFLSTRLDNDDALAVGYVHCLQGVVANLTGEQFGDSDALYVNFPKGLQWYKGDYYDFEDVTNAFVSLLERSDEPHTVFWVDHPCIHDVAPVVQAETRPLWLQNVHDLNVYNYVRGEKLDQADFSKAFPHLG